MAADGEQRLYRVPERAVTNPMLMGAWERSEGRARLVAFVGKLGEAAEGRSARAARVPSAGVAALVEELRALERLAAGTELEESPQRFGNRAFRGWHAAMEGRVPALLERLAVPAEARAAVLPYYCGAFGNPTRLDFGTGHELSFVAWLCTLATVGALRPEDLPCAVLDAYPAYLAVIRRCITHFQLEPAGSRGSQGLDDYTLLPYFFGACQMVRADGSPVERRDEEAAALLATSAPGDLIRAEGVDQFAGDSLFAGAVEFVCQCKTGAPLAEHSPTLYSLRDVEWAKVRRGMSRMHNAEVLASFPCIQHLPLGGLLPLDPVVRPPRQRAAPPQL